MMLALKSEHFIKPQHIHKLHKVTGIKETEILDMFQRLRNTLDKRKMNYIHHKELQNKAYILMKRTSFMLDNIKDKTKLYDSLKSATHFHNETWKRHTEILKSLHTIVPTNGDVSKILGLSDPQIRRLQSFIEGFERTVRKRHKRKEKS